MTCKKGDSAFSQSTCALTRKRRLNSRATRRTQAPSATWGQPAREARNAQPVVLQDEYRAPSRRIHHGDAHGLDREH